MKNSALKNTFIGVLLLAMAVGFIFGKVGIGTVVWCGILVYVLAGAIKKKQYLVMFIDLALIYGALDDYLDIAFGFGKIFIACLVIGVALSMIFGRGKHLFGYKVYDDEGNLISDGKRNYSSETYSEGGSSVRIDNCFGASVKYVNADNYKSGAIDNSFGQVVCYFNEAVIREEKAEIKVDNAFGSVKLYIPKDWKIEVERDNTFGAINLHGAKAEYSDAPTLTIKADNAFGAIDIYCE